MRIDRGDPLVAQSCVPCRGGVPPLDAEQADVFRQQIHNWALRDDARRLERRFGFKTYAEAFGFVTRVSGLAEAEGHHPDIQFGWGYATVSLHTHVIGGLHRNDFVLAAKIDRLADQDR